MEILRFKQFEKSITWISKDINIRIDVEASKHAMDRFFRHGLEEKITEGDIIDVIEKSVEELTIALMTNELNIQEVFHLKDKESDLNIVAKLIPGKDEFKMIVITVMREKNFKVKDGEFVLEV